MDEFLAKAQRQFAAQLPFVLYSKPDAKELVGLFQQDDRLHEGGDFNEKGFVFASFDGSQTYLIPEKESIVETVLFNANNAVINSYFEETLNDADKTDFEGLVSKGIQAIANNAFQKVVLSRKETVLVQNFDFSAAFNKLVHLYPATFVYCFYHPKVGMWLGATPEQLLKADANRFETIALAGTQKDTGLTAIVWENKEKEEQQFVTNYIVDKLETVSTRLQVSQPYSIKAGTIWHIKTDISGVLNSGFRLQQVVQLLHPTPAVCGLPKEKAKSFIIENEHYDREFYTGYLGELNSGDSTQSSTDLFVNLRCMQIGTTDQEGDTKVSLYMGCGITKDSIAEKEWNESRNKSMTMKKVLRSTE